MAGTRLPLLPGEEILVDIRPHWLFLWGPLVVAALAVAAGVALDIGFPHTSVRVHWVEGLVVAVPCVWLAARVVRWRRTRLVLTRVRLVELWGVASRQQDEVRLVEVASVRAVQSLARRVVGAGELELALRDTGEIRVVGDVRKPVVLARVVSRRLLPADVYDPTRR